MAPYGGGLLNEYGRELSLEALSSTGKDGEQYFAQGLIKTAKWLKMGGDFREAFIYQDTPSFREGRSQFMQADIEAGVDVEKWLVMGSIGYRDPLVVNSWRDNVISRRHSITYRFSDEGTVRAGRFLPAFGINTAEHTYFTRAGIGFNQGSESYNLEYSRITPNFSTFLTWINGRPDDPSLNKETGAALTQTYSPKENLKLGVSYLYGDSPQKRHLFGPHALIGFSTQFFLLSELDFQSMDQSFGHAQLQKFGFEPTKGLIVFVTEETSKLNWQNDQSWKAAYGFGIQYFPRPHFEFSLNWQKRQSKTLYDGFYDLAWLFIHYYL